MSPASPHRSLLGLGPVTAIRGEDIIAQSDQPPCSVISGYYSPWIMTEAPGLRCWPGHNAGDACDESPESISGSGSEGSDVRLWLRLRLW